MRTKGKGKGKAKGKGMSKERKRLMEMHDEALDELAQMALDGEDSFGMDGEVDNFDALMGGLEDEEEDVDDEGALGRLLVLFAITHDVFAYCTILNRLDRYYSTSVIPERTGLESDVLRNRAILLALWTARSLPLQFFRRSLEDALLTSFR